MTETLQENKILENPEQQIENAAEKIVGKFIFDEKGEVQRDENTAIILKKGEEKRLKEAREELVKILMQMEINELKKKRTMAFSGFQNSDSSSREGVKYHEIYSACIEAIKRKNKELTEEEGKRHTITLIIKSVFQQIREKFS